ncbi:MAG: Rrf2 family transcriptional regulator [bacterium]|nr:Rrf2 family transcriptional regulator [bacterium]
MIVLTRKAEYALLAMAYLGRCHDQDQVSSAREIADRYRVPSSVLMNILKTLQRSGLVQSARGARGGYRLAREAESITLAEIVSSVEGPVQVTRCTGHDDGGDSEAATNGDACERSPWCPVRGPAQVVQEKLNQFFTEVNLADLVSRNCPASVTATT